MIGVDENTANIDAEGIEHHIHPETLEKLERFVKIVKSSTGFSVMRDPKIHTDRNFSPVG
jgi:Mn-dependent DtxR family transcriptional regulator